LPVARVCFSSCDVEAPQAAWHRNKYTQKTFAFPAYALIIHQLEITMLSWDEEVTPTASLPPTPSRPNPLKAERFAGPSAQLTQAPAVAQPSPAQTRPATPPGMVLGTHRRVNAADNRIING
jgi:hypothetical protein